MTNVYVPIDVAVSIDADVPIDVYVPIRVDVPIDVYVSVNVVVFTVVIPAAVTISLIMLAVS
jgi:hypothetical protein